MIDIALFALFSGAVITFYLGNRKKINKVKKQVEKPLKDLFE